MSVLATSFRAFEFNRGRTFALLEKIEQEPDPIRVLGWRPGAGRAHIAWQLMHVAITEELFGTERLAPPKQAGFADLVPRFKGGSVPDDSIPTAAVIRETLAGARKTLLATLTEIGDGRLDERPEALKARGWTVHDVLNVIGWHEAHHQGQAHITFNLYKAATSG